MIHGKCVSGDTVQIKLLPVHYARPCWHLEEVFTKINMMWVI